MSYGLKYYATFKNYFEETITVNIYGRDYAGASVEIKLIKESEAILSYPGDDRDLNHPIFGSQVKIKMLSETDFQFIELHSSDSRAYRVDILKDSVLDWRGWVLPDLFNEPYIAPPYPVEITARCGIGELKERYIPEKMTKLLTATTGSADVSDFVNLYTIIGSGLLDIETELKLNDCINVHHDLAATANNSTLYDTYINLKSYEGLTYYEAFEDILRSFGARLYQQGGEWWIVRVSEYREELTVRQWTISRPINNSFTLDETKLTTFLIGKNTYSKADKTGGMIVNQSPSLDILPAWKEFDIIQDWQIKDNIFENGDFEKWDNDYGLPTTREGARSAKSFVLSDWDVPYQGFVSRNIDSEGNSFITLNEGYSDGMGLKQTVPNVEISLTERQYLKVKIQLDIVSYNTSKRESIFSFEFRTIGLPFNKKLRFNFNTEEFEWVSEDAESTLPFAYPFETTVVNIIPASYVGAAYNRAGNVSFEWKTFEYIFPGIPSEGDLTFEIRGTNDSQLKLRLNLISCKIVDVNGKPFAKQDLINTVVNSKNIYIPDDVKLIGGDLPDIDNNRHIWYNYYAKSTGSPTTSWKEKGGTIKQKLIQLLANDYKRRIEKPQFKLSIPILSPTIKFDSCIIDYLIPKVKSKKYLCNSAEYNYQTGILRGDYIEFADWEGYYWILISGYWDDQGVWDDEAEWKDDESDIIEIDVTGVGDHDISSNFSSGDTFTTLISDVPQFGGYLKEDDIVIDAVPYIYEGGLLEFNSGFEEVFLAHTVYFEAIVGGLSKTVKINVNL